MNKKIKTFASNLIYAFMAQGIALFLSIVMSLVIPKVLGLKEFAYWQLFLFYSSYVGFSLLGLNDGIYLRIGGTPYNKVNSSLLGSQFWLSIFGQLFVALCIAAYAVWFVTDPQRKFVWLATAGYLLLFNAIGYLTYIFQATNNTKRYSVSVMIDKVIFIVCIAGLLVFKVRHFQLFVLFYLVSKVFGLGYCLIVGRQIVFVPLPRISTVVKEMYTNIAVGINLMLSNIASMLILGSGRFVVDHRWGIEAFGKFSFALSLTNFFLMFISQISMVLFPALRQTNEDNIKGVYNILRDGLSLTLYAIFLLYLPIKYLLGLWLPQYTESLKYLALLLPLCTFDSKMQMLFNTYLKVLRKEKKLLLINTGVFAVSIVCSVLGAYVINSIYAVVIAMVASVALRSIVAELYVSKLFHKPVGTSLWAECGLAVLFSYLSWFTPSLTAFGVYFVAYASYLFLYRKKVESMMLTIKTVFSRAA